VYQSVHAFCAIKLANCIKIATCGLAEEMQNKIGAGINSHNCDILPPLGGAILQRISSKFGQCISTEIVTIAKFGSKMFIGIFRPKDGKKRFPFGKPIAYHKPAR